MNIYFNAEYTGLNENAKLISLGFMTGDGEKLYIEVANVPQYLITPEIRAAILPDTYLYDTSIESFDDRIEAGEQAAEKYNYTYRVVYNDQIGGVVDKWFQSLLEDRTNEKIQLVSYCSHYDFCLLLNTFQGQIPEYLNPVCYDIYQDMIESLGEYGKPFSQRVDQTLSAASSFLTTGEVDGYMRKIDMPEYPKDHSLKFAHLIKHIHEIF